MTTRPEKPIKQRSTQHRNNDAKRGANKQQLLQLKELFVSLLTDSFNTLDVYSLADYTRDVSTIENRIDNEGIGFAALIMPVLSQGVFDYLEHGYGSYDGFSCTVGGYPHFLKGVFRIVYNSDKFAEKVVANAINCIYQVSVFTKKISGDYKVEKLTEQYQNLLETDIGNASVFERLDNDAFQVLETARYYCRRFTANLDFDRGFIPRPGPGATNTPVPKSLRYKPLKYFSQHQAMFPYEEWFYSHPWDIVTEACGDRSFREITRTPIDEPTARAHFVPKVYSKARSICIEENESQFLQQAVSAGLREHVRHSELNGHVEFNDQSINALHALNASVDKENCTIDMSEASNRVPRDVVSWVVQDNTLLHNGLMALSTRWMEPPRDLAASFQKHKLFMFAPMGSGLCFPVMSLMHYFLIAAIVMRVHHHDVRSELYVYGDDIVLPSRYAQAVFDHLPKFGMKLNRSKSFVKSNFRESCGTHAYNGMDITPVFLRKTISSGKAITESIVSALSTEYLLFKKGFTTTASVLRRQVRNVWKNEVPYVLDESGLFGFKRPNTFIANRPDTAGAKRKTKWHKDYQCYVERRQILKTLSDEPTEIDSQNQAYLRWLTTQAQSPTLFQDGSTQITTGWDWVASHSSTVKLKSRGDLDQFATDDKTISLKRRLTQRASLLSLLRERRDALAA